MRGKSGESSLAAAAGIGGQIGVRVVSPSYSAAHAASLAAPLHPSHTKIPICHNNLERMLYIPL